MEKVLLLGSDFACQRSKTLCWIPLPVKRVKERESILAYGVKLVWFIVW